MQLSISIFHIFFMHSNSTVTKSFYWQYAETIGRYLACLVQLEDQLGSLYTQSKAYYQPALNIELV